MARSALPDFGREYPPYQYQPWPRQVGLDADGEQIVAKDQEEYDRLLPTRVFPKVMGKDKNGVDVIARIPRDLQWLKASVATPPEDPAVIQKRKDDEAAAIAERDRKAAEYDKLMAEKNALADQKTDGKAKNALTGASKAKAA